MLIPLDTKHMFNAISREKKLGEVISQEFPQLEDYADLLYELPGETVVKRGYGIWERIQSEEGFAQCCLLSPVFAGMVLYHITKNIYTLLRIVPIVMGYIDNVNALVPIEDTAEYLRLFEYIGGQLLRSHPQHRKNKNIDLQSGR